MCNCFADDNVIRGNRLAIEILNKGSKENQTLIQERNKLAEELKIVRTELRDAEAAIRLIGHNFQEAR